MELSDRNPGCEAVLFDDGRNQRIPVCMGGTALGGCNNYDAVCKDVHSERSTNENPGFVNVVFQDDTGRVNRIVSVPRAPLVVPEG